MTLPTQKILFGSPGTGKSHFIKTEILPSLGIDPDGPNCIPTVFHPEYSYGDFMGKLLPYSITGNVRYNYFPGHFLRALAKAYKNILTNATEPNVALVIDEINRGNSAGIFGTVFQLLDRDHKGWSTYKVDVSDMEFESLLRTMGAKIDVTYGGDGHPREKTYVFDGNPYHGEQINRLLAPLNIRQNQICLPNNLSILATMNTSDNSIYYMDSAFKRRWDWEYISNGSVGGKIDGNAFSTRGEWESFVDKLNNFIKSQQKHVRQVEDKMIGYWFISSDEISKSQLQNKVMFYLWDSVFNTHRKPLAELLEIDLSDLVTFGDFASHVDSFTSSLMAR